MGKAIGVIVALALVALAIYIVLSTPTAPVTSQHDSTSVIEPAEIPADAAEATVEYIHDGDTLFLTDGTKVRLLAVDTPELGDCYGDEATAFLRELLPEGSTIYTEMDVEATDQYGRSLLFIYTATGTLVNLQLVEQGYAEAVFIGANRLHEHEFEAAEDAAHDLGRGMWGAC